MHAQISLPSVEKDTTIHLSAGTLSTLLTTSQKATITNLKLIGTMDARDFKTMRDSMPALSVIDINDVSILSYSGTQGTEANTIPESAFAGCTNLINITIPIYVTSIGRNAFCNCKSLKNITIPNSVTSIGDTAFSGCALTSIIIPNSITEISGSLFCESDLTDIIIPISVTSIGNGAFIGCPMTDIIIPNSVTSMGVYAFWDSYLTNITIPNSVTSINSYTFGRCGLLTSISIPNSVTSIGDYAFYVSGLISINLPNSITTIGRSAFEKCHFTSIEIPNSVTSIGSYAFSGLTSIYAYSIIPIDLSSSPNVFEVDKTICVLYVPAGSKFFYQSANQWKDFLNIIEMAPTGTSELPDKEHFILYPNPVKEGFYIDAVEGPATISIHNLSGIELLSRQVTGKSYVDMTGLPSGVYFVKITTSEGNLVKKLIKK